MKITINIPNDKTALELEEALKFQQNKIENKIDVINASIHALNKLSKLDSSPKAKEQTRKNLEDNLELLSSYEAIKQTFEEIQKSIHVNLYME